MVLNIIWVSFFVLAFLVAVVRLFFFGDMEVFPKIVTGTFDSAKTAFEMSIWLTGLLALWMGLMNIAEKSGLINVMAKLVGPFFERLFPALPKNHPAMGSIIMNISANMLGLDNASTPLGLKAMEEMQKLNPVKEEASDPQIMFLVLNTSGLTVIPITVMSYRAQLGAVNPSDVFIPILLATMASTLAGLMMVAAYQKLKLWDKVVMSYLGGLLLFMVGTLYFFAGMTNEQIGAYSSVVSNFIVFSMIFLMIVYGTYKKANVYDLFIDGAKGGFKMAVRLIPFLVAILVGIGVFRDSGCLQLIMDGLQAVVGVFGIDGAFIHALPTALMKPLSGSGARGLMIDAMRLHGADSLIGRMVCAIQGSTDTTLYIIAVYFGSVGIQKPRYAVKCGLIADLVGIIAAILLSYLFFGEG